MDCTRSREKVGRSDRAIPFHSFASLLHRLRCPALVKVENPVGIPLILLSFTLFGVILLTKLTGRISTRKAIRSFKFCARPGLGTTVTPLPRPL